MWAVSPGKKPSTLKAQVREAEEVSTTLRTICFHVRREWYRKSTKPFMTHFPRPAGSMTEVAGAVVPEPAVAGAVEEEAGVAPAPAVAGAVIAPAPAVAAAVVALAPAVAGAGAVVASAPAVAGAVAAPMPWIDRNHNG